MDYSILKGGKFAVWPQKHRFVTESLCGGQNVYFTRVVRNIKDLPYYKEASGLGKVVIKKLPPLCINPGLLPLKRQNL